MANPAMSSPTADTGDRELVLLGRISGLYGVRGWVRVFSYTEPRENILAYRHWLVRRGAQWTPVTVAEGRRHGKGIVVRLEGCTDRDAAAGWLESEIAVPRSALPPLAPGEYYWTDLQGMEVETVQGEVLGSVDFLLHTAANDVLVVKGERERLIPFLQGQVVLEVDPESRRIVVDWDPDF